MSILIPFLHVVHIVVCVFLVITILLQAGKGGGMGAAFGGAGSQTVFGGRGAQTFLGKLTAVFAGVFFVTSLALSFTSTRARSILEGEVAPVEAPAPAADVPAGMEGAVAPEGAEPVPSSPPTAVPPAAPEGDGVAP